jgi:hypothetical protein
MWTLVVWTLIFGHPATEKMEKVPGWSSEFTCEEAARALRRKEFADRRVTSADCLNEQPFTLPTPR